MAVSLTPHPISHPQRPYSSDRFGRPSPIQISTCNIFPQKVKSPIRQVRSNVGEAQVESVVGAKNSCIFLQIPLISMTYSYVGLLCVSGIPWNLIQYETKNICNTETFKAASEDNSKQDD